MEKAVALQYGPDELAAAKSENLAPDRRWVVWDGKVPSSDRRRLFAPQPASKSMVMCVGLLLGEQAAKLDEVRKFCASLAF
jgi:hypothetical protein